MYVFIDTSLSLSLSQAIRVLVSSSDAESAHPLLVNVRQPRAITSWALPYVEGG